MCHCLLPRLTSPLTWRKTLTLRRKRCVKENEGVLRGERGGEEGEGEEGKGNGRGERSVHLLCIYCIVRDSIQMHALVKSLYLNYPVYIYVRIVQ